MGVGSLLIFFTSPGLIELSNLTKDTNFKDFFSWLEHFKAFKAEAPLEPHETTAQTYMNSFNLWVLLQRTDRTESDAETFLMVSCGIWRVSNDIPNHSRESVRLLLPTGSRKCYIIGKHTWRGSSRCCHISSDPHSKVRGKQHHTVYGIPQTLPTY